MPKQINFTIKGVFSATAQWNVSVSGVNMPLAMIYNCYFLKEQIKNFKKTLYKLLNM